MAKPVFLRDSRLSSAQPGALPMRLCEICGHVGCCDSSKNRHATKHFRKTKHPIMRSFEPGEDWGWCYIDAVMIEPFR